MILTCAGYIFRCSGGKEDKRPTQAPRWKLDVLQSNLATVQDALRKLELRLEDENGIRIYVDPEERNRCSELPAARENQCCKK